MTIIYYTHYIDVFTTNVMKGVVSHYHTTVTDNEIPPLTSDVEHLCTVDNVWINAVRSREEGETQKRVKEFRSTRIPITAPSCPTKYAIKQVISCLDSYMNTINLVVVVLLAL